MAVESRKKCNFAAVMKVIHNIYRIYSPPVILTIFILLVNIAVKPVLSMAKAPVIAPSYAWTMLEPLCLREPSTIDTLFLDYSRRFVPSDVSAAYATTGNYNSPGQNMLYFERQAVSDFFFHDAVSHWLPVLGDHKFYNTRIPMSLLSYNTGGSRDDAQDHLNLIFSGNASPQLQIGAMLDYPYSKGSYSNQASKAMIWGLSGSYTGEHLEIQAFFNHFNHVNKENGGITDDLYITDPAEMQGGSATIRPKNIPTRLSNAHSRLTGAEFLANVRYKIGYWNVTPPVDSIPGDTVEHRTFVPVSSFIWTVDYRDGTHIFDESSASEIANFWTDRYLTATHTHDVTSYHSVRNTLGISLVEGFHKYAKGGLAAFMTHEYRKYSQTPDTIPMSGEGRPDNLTPYPLNSQISPYHSENLLSVGGQLTKQQGSLLRYEATGTLGLIGRIAGDIDLRGHASVRVPLMRDTLGVTAYGHFTNKAAPYLFNKFVSNNFIWSNDFGKTRSLRIGGRLDFPLSDTHLDVGVENIQHALYFDAAGKPAQDRGNVQVFSATLRQGLHAGILHWDNRITYQTTSNDAVIPMPRLAVYSNLYILFRVAHVLHVQLGVDCDYYTRYYSPGYQPATMAFYNQREMKTGNFPFMNAYVNMKLRKARFYVMMSHVNQGLFGNDYFAMPHYPLNPRRFQMGVSVDFSN